MTRREFITGIVPGAVCLATVRVGAAECTAPAVEALGDIQTFDYLGGGWQMYMFAGRTIDISLSTLFRSPSGRLVMVDGGWAEDGEFLLPVLKALGGTVDTWFLTHAHSDHYGALGAIIKKPACGGLRIGRVVHDFLPLAFIEETATSPATAPHVREFLGNLAQSGLKVERPAVGQMYDFGEGLSFECLNGYDLSFRRDSVNNSSICYRVLDNGRSILVTGDVSEEMGAKMVRTLPPEKLKSDVCFMAHHGQAGADKAFYAAVRPEVCIWPTPQWLWDNDFGGTNGPGSGEFLTNYVKCWMQDLGVKRQILLVRDWRMV